VYSHRCRRVPAEALRADAKRLSSHAPAHSSESGHSTQRFSYWNYRAGTPRVETLWRRREEIILPFYRIYHRPDKSRTVQAVPAPVREAVIDYGAASKRVSTNLAYSALYFLIGIVVFTRHDGIFA
jgi:hypothetical protein